MKKSIGKKFVLKLGRLIEKTPLKYSIKDEIGLEYAILPHIKKFIQKELTGNKVLDGILYHHGRNKREKEWWAKSKKLQNVKLFGTNVSDMFIVHPKIGAVALEFKYVKLSRKGEGLTGSIQRAIGQSLIATMRHPFAVCVIIYRQQKKHLEPGVIQKLKKSLWEQRRVYLIIRKHFL